MPNKGKESKTLLAPNLRGKKRPRGKPFTKGNRFGLSTRFPQGISANPGGRPKSAEISKAARALLACELPGDHAGRTYAEAVVEVMANRALAGNITAAAELADRAEGRPRIGLEFGTGDDPLTDLVAYMHAESRRIGPPEGSLRSLSGGQNEEEFE